MFNRSSQFLHLEDRQFEKPQIEVFLRKKSQFYAGNSPDGTAESRPIKIRGAKRSAMFTVETTQLSRARYNARKR